VFITACTSEMPLVSLKFFISRFWYAVVFYFLGVVLFARFGNILKYLWLYMLPLGGVVVYTLFNHSKFNFSLGQSYNVMTPFFDNHGVYAATICIFIPLLTCYILFYNRLAKNMLTWFASLFLLVLFLTGIYFSFTRAAWIGLAAAACFLVPMVLRIRFNTLLFLIFTSGFLLYTFQNEIVYVLSKTDHTNADGFSNRLRSISNIKTDPSNTERINRWMSALAMFEERPVLGFGPGTYSFCYAPYQQARFKTEISTNFGDNGNSHSEYFNPLAESGLPGALTFLFIFYSVLNSGFRLFYTARKFKVRIISLSIVLGLITYLAHGIFNNYSEMDKVASLLWGGFGIITALDIYHNKRPEGVDQE
jgi:O-antigen ligase